MIGVASGANAGLTPDDIDGLPGSLFTPDAVLLLAGLEVPLVVARRAAERAFDARMRTVLNPAPVDPGLLDSRLLEFIDVLTPNRGELGQLTSRTVETRDDALAACDWLQTGWPRRLNVVVTLGAHGCLVRAVDQTVRTIPGHTVRARDAVGRGDAFSGTLAVALAEGRSLFEAAAWANAAAALSVTLPGAQPGLPTRDEIDRFAHSPRLA